MHNQPMCPMMANMPMMSNMPTMQMPMQPMMTGCMHSMPVDEDIKDDDYFVEMYSDTCHKMMPYIVKTVDTMEQKGELLYEDYPKKVMIDNMTEEAYKDMMKDNPAMAAEMGESRQYYAPQALARDLLGVLLIGEIARRRRRRRRPYLPYPGYGYYSPYGYNYDYGYNDFYYYD